MSEASMETFGALMNRLGKRTEGKLIGISTPSFTEDNALISVQRAARSGESLPGVVLTEYISHQKDYKDESGWGDANPGLAAGLLDIGALRTDMVLLTEQQFRAYRLCQNPTGSESCWLNALDDAGSELGDAYDIWQRGESPFTMQPDAPIWVGCDVAKSRDHAAVVWGQFRSDGRLHTKCKVWTPTNEHDIDLEEVADHLRWLSGKYRVEQIWYDPAYFYNAPLLLREGLPMVEVPQTEQRMAPIVGHAYQSIRRNRISHDEDKQYTSHVLAAKRRYGARGFTLEKRNFGNKIDAAIALCLCHAAAMGLGEEEVTLESLQFHTI
jgi:hypothetical protein